MGYKWGGFKINDAKVKWIAPVLEQWIFLHKEYIEKYNFGDCLYWYNERANVSAFAGAVWRAGGFALEEYSSKKGSEENLANGRVDLFFSKGDDKAIAEAKMEWLYFGRRTRLDLRDKIDRVISRAKVDIENSLGANPYKLGLGISFIAPYWRSGYDSSKDVQGLKKIVEECDCSFYAIFESQGEVVSSKRNVCNSVILVGTAHG